MSQTSAAENATGTFTSGKGETESVSPGLQHVTATTACGSDGLAPSSCVVFLQVEHPRTRCCSSCPTSSVLPGEEELSISLARFPLQISLVHEEYGCSLFATTVRYRCCLLSCWTQETNPDTSGLKGLTRL